MVKIAFLYLTSSWRLNTWPLQYWLIFTICRWCNPKFSRWDVLFFWWSDRLGCWQTPQALWKSLWCHRYGERSKILIFFLLPFWISWLARRPVISEKFVRRPWSNFSDLQEQSDLELNYFSRLSCQVICSSWFFTSQLATFFRSCQDIYHGWFSS